MMAGKEVRNVLKRMKNWALGLPKTVKWLMVILCALLAGIAVLYLFVLLIALLMVGWVNHSTNARIGPEHYQYTYAMIEDWNRSATRDREDIFGYGEYLYNSHMLLFPRETPSTLKEYYFYWSQSIDVDYYGVYFTCQMTESDYDDFAEGMESFAMTTAEGIVSPICDTEHFAYPTYILQWLDEGEKFEVLEYIMLDEENLTAVFVYTLGALEKIEENSAYAVTPRTMDVLSSEQCESGFSFELPGIQQFFSGFSLYDDFDTATYDLSFLDYLK